MFDKLSTNPIFGRTEKNLVVKEVDLFGDKVTAAKDDNGDIWVAVRWLCQGLGMTEGQWKRQITNIKQDSMLSEGVQILILPTKSGKQDVFCLKNDYVPIWLTKIAITPNIRESNPELADKLMRYQLKAKDILADAFNPKAVIPKTAGEQILLLAEGYREMQEQINAVSDTVEAVRNEFTDFKQDCPLFPVDMDRISRTARKKGVEVMGGKSSIAYHDRSIVQMVYRDIYGEIHRNFGCRSYKEIARKNIDKAIEVIENYTLPMYLTEKIEQSNR